MGRKSPETDEVCGKRLRTPGDPAGPPAALPDHRGRVIEEVHERERTGYPAGGADTIVARAQTAEGKTSGATARATQNTVVLEISDTGVGIPLDVDAFEPFMTTKKEGTGIELVIVR
jgi:signal transduction histidine kinase